MTLKDLSSLPFRTNLTIFVKVKDDKDLWLVAWTGNDHKCFLMGNCTYMDDPNVQITNVYFVPRPMGFYKDAYGLIEITTQMLRQLSSTTKASTDTQTEYFY